MNAFYTISFSALATGSVADTFKTLAAAIWVSGRVRLRGLSIGFTDDTADDKEVSIRVSRSDNTVAGSGGTAIAASAIPKMNPSAPDPGFTGRTGHTAEPTVYTALWETAINSRGSFEKEWGPDDAPVLSAAGSLGLLFAPRNGAAREISGTLKLETFL